MGARRIYTSKRIKNRKQAPELGLNECVREKTNRSFSNRKKDIQKSYCVKTSSPYVGLRGGASSPDEDDSGNHRVGGNDNDSDQSMDGDDSLYRVDIQGGLSDEPADTSYEYTNRNAPETENLENHMAQNDALVNSSNESHYNGAPASQGHMEDDTSDGESNGGFVASEDVDGHVFRNVAVHRNHRVPQNDTLANGVNECFSSRGARPSRGRMADDARGRQVNGVTTAPPISRRTSIASRRSRVDSLRDPQQEEDDYVIDWWLCEPLGRTPSNATHSSSVASELEHEYFARQRSLQEYNPTAGYYDIQENSSSSTLFPPPPNSMLSQVPYLDPGPASNIWPTNLGPPDLPSRHTSGTLARPPATTDTADGTPLAAGRRRRNAILARLRATWRGVKRGGSRFGRDMFKRR